METQRLPYSEILFRSLCDGGQLSLFIVDIDETGDFIYGGLHSAHEKAIGLSSADIVGKRPEEVPGLTREQAAAVRANYQRCIDVGKAITYEELFTVNEKSSYWMTRLTPLFDETGHIYRIVGSSHDISQIKELQRRLHLIAETIEEVFWMTRPDCEQIVYINSAYDTVWGTDKETLIATPHALYESIHPDDRENFSNVPWFSAGKWSSEYRIMRPDGAVRWIGDRGFPVHDKDTGIHYMVGVARDITEHKQKEHEVRSSEEMFRSIFDAALDGILIADTETHKFKMANPAICQMTGYTETEIKGLGIENIHPQSDLPSVLETFARQAKREIEISGDIPVLRKDGSIFFADVNSAPIVIDGHSYMLGLFRDTTERREVESIRLQAQRMDALGNLAAGVAHDINNMLLPIMNLLPMVMRDIPEDNSNHNRLDMALKAADRMKDMAARILAFSRDEEAEATEIDICETLEAAMDILRMTLPSTIKIVEELDDGTGGVLANPKQVEAVLMNLASNAADAMENKPGTMTITLNPVEVDAVLAKRVQNLRVGPYARLTVSDTGCGMDEGVLKHIFDPLFTTKGTGRGTGLGLAMVFGTATKYGGAIGVSSTPGEGSTFEVYLPIATSTLPRKPSKPQK